MKFSENIHAVSIFALYFWATISPSFIGMGYKNTEPQLLWYLLGGLGTLLPALAIYQGIANRINGENKHFLFLSVFGSFFLLLGIILCWYFQFYEKVDS